jgi:hypothetical protein
MMDHPDLLNLRTALLITLSILLVAVLWRKFRLRVLANDMPAPLHAELLALELVYHPARLHVVIHVPEPQTIGTAVLDHAHRSLHQWNDLRLVPGEHSMELTLPDLSDGTYFLALTTATQRTERQFRLQRA